MSSDSPIARAILKTCTKCGDPQPPSEFYRNGTRSDGSEVFRPDCKRCSRRRTKDSRSVEWEEAYQARRFYGLTLEEAREYWHADSCAICGSTDPKDRRKKFHIDHCHKTGKVRGALCSNCNLGLGSLQDNPELLRKAALYLERSA